MAGFVDPAFKNIKVEDPNFLIWRLSKLPGEYYEAKEIRKALYGNFYDEDSYIVYSSTPVKKILGSPNRGLRSKMEIHIHFWLGTHILEDEIELTIQKALELDLLLGGICVLHREMQGHESNRFLSYFKTGLTIKKGEVTTVSRQKGDDPKPTLYELSERSSTIILTEQPSISWSFVKSSSVFALETRQSIFIWVGKEADNEVKYSALKFQKQMEAFNPNRKTVCVIDGEENELDGDERALFEEHLNLDSKSVKLNTAEKDLLLVRSKSRGVIKLYKIACGERDSTITHVKNGPLEQSDLDTSDICIVEHSMNDIWVWVGKKVAEEEKIRGINFGIAYLENKIPLQLEMRKMNVHKVLEGYEPQEFKLIFGSWADTFPLTSDQYFSRKTGKPVNATFTAKKLEDSPFLAAESQLFDYGSGQMSVFVIHEDSLIPLDPDEFGIFHSRSKYLIHYSYTVDEKGNDVSPTEKENIWPSLKHIPEFGGTYVRVCIQQFKETPHFCAIFQGKMIIINTLPPKSGGEMVLDKYPVLILKVTGTDALNARSVDVTSEAFSFNVNDVYILRTSKISFIWCGAQSKGDEREMARNIANKWARSYTVILQGHESKEFYELLGQFRTHIAKPEPVPVQINVPATLYKCSRDESNLIVSEIINFSQTDLGSGDVFILDTWGIIFVWTGEDVPESSLDELWLVSSYLRMDPCGRALDLPIIRVNQDHEPPTFYGFFATWNKSWKESYDVEAVKKLFGAEEKSKTYVAASDPVLPTPESNVGQENPEDSSDVSSDKDMANNVSPSKDETKHVNPSEDIDDKEKISDESFAELFGMSRTIFHKLPLWKQKKMRRDAGFV